MNPFGWVDYTANYTTNANSNFYSLHLQQQMAAQSAVQDWAIGPFSAPAAPPAKPTPPEDERAWLRRRVSEITALAPKLAA